MKSGYDYEQGDMVDFEYNSVKGYGMVCGCSITHQPIVGRSYIVEVRSAVGIDEDVYPFLCISIPECFFQLRP